jgi:DNA-binding NtrC family response regulator
MDQNPWEVVVVSSKLENRQDVAGMLARLGLDPICVSSVNQCRDLPNRDGIGLVFCDRHVKDGDYRDVVSAMGTSAVYGIPKVVLMADLASPTEYQQAKLHGVFDVISSPCRPTDIEWMVIQAKRNRRQARELVATRNLSLLWRAVGA